MLVFWEHSIRNLHSNIEKILINTNIIKYLIIITNKCRGQKTTFGARIRIALHPLWDSICYRSKAPQLGWQDPMSLHSQQLVKTYTILQHSFLKQYGSGKQIDLFVLARQVLYQLSHPPAHKVAFKVINICN